MLVQLTTLPTVLYHSVRQMIPSWLVSAQVLDFVSFPSCNSPRVCGWKEKTKANTEALRQEVISCDLLNLS